MLDLNGACKVSVDSFIGRSMSWPGSRCRERLLVEREVTCSVWPFLSTTYGPVNPSLLQEVHFSFSPERVLKQVESFHQFQEYVNVHLDLLR